MLTQHQIFRLCRNTPLFTADYSKDAAQLAGLPIAKWISLEEGWIPDLSGNAMLAIAGTLETPVDQLNLLANSKA